MKVFCSECGEEVPDSDNNRAVCNDDTVVCGPCTVDMPAEELERN